MSHFVTWVIAPADEVRARGAEPAAESLLAPFDENIEVPEYQRPCPCGEWRARMSAHARVQEELADLQAEVVMTRERFLRERQAAGEDESGRARLEQEHRAYWDTHVVPVIVRMEAAEDAFVRADPRTPDAACSECHGSGTYVSTYNPDSKWDWWEVGGRWRGGFDPTGADRDVLGVSEVIASYDDVMLPVALVTPDGTWHEEGSVGWFGTMTSQVDAQAWNDEVAAALARHANDVIIVCDLHI